MTKSKLVSVLPALCFSWLVTGCPDDATETASDTNNDTGSESSDSDPDSTVSVTISTSETMTTTDDTDTDVTTTGPSTTLTTDPDSSGTDPTDATESGSSTDPTDATESSSSTDPTDATESSSGSDSGSTDPTGATGTDTGTLACVDDDLGNALPVAEMGTNVGAGDDFTPSCSDGNDEDVVLEWTAPADGTYQFDTIDSDFDTVLSLFSDCDGTELACADDIDYPDNVQSGFVIDLTEGQTVLVVVDGYDVSGNFVLNITEVLPNMGVAWGDCVNQDVQAGCSEAETNCLVDDLMDPTLGVCTALCGGDDECSDAPATGNAPAICGDLGGGTTVCMLDCSADQTCPDGMQCVDTFYCAWPVD